MPSFLNVAVLVDEAVRRRHAGAIGAMLTAVCIAVWMILFRGRR